MHRTPVLWRTLFSAARFRIANSVEKARSPIKFRKKRTILHPLALALLRIQFNAMNLAIRLRAAAYGLILTESKLTIGNPFSLLTLS